MLSRVFDIANQLLSRQSPSRHSCRLMNEQQSLYDLVLVEILLDYDC